MKIFDIENGKVKINENCLLIPELNVLIEKYENPIAALSYCHYMTHPDSPYHNLPDNKKQQMISDDMGGDFGLDDDEIENVLVKLQSLYATPTQDYYEGQKNAMYVMSKKLKNLTEESLTEGRDGNIGDIFRMQKEAGKVMESFLKLEKLWQEQSQQKLRGNAEQGEY